MMAETFRRLDVDGSGYLDAEKVISLVGQFDIEGDLAKAAALISFWDLDGDDQVDLHEFMETMPLMVLGMSDEEAEAVLKGYVLSKHFLDCDSREEKLEFLFASIDKDHSETLTMDEIFRLAIKMDPSTTMEIVKNTFELLDKDNSGEVDKAEFVKVMLELLGQSEENSFDRKVCIMLKPAEVPPNILETVMPPKYSKFVSSFVTQEDAHQIGCSEFLKLMAEDSENLTVIDVRSEEEREMQ
ncbi:hypothetical protein BSKO_06963 [Bryopsis sp. KO-2023]|nr:hypothetical protein BSKO_06963 [Bryopsis sp. KO-2023]